MEILCYSPKVSRLVCLFLLFASIPPVSADEVTPLAVGIFPGILSPPGVEQSVMGLRVSPLVGIHRNVHGLDVGLVNIALGNEGALQVGIFNYQQKRMSILGLQAGGLINWNAGNVSGAGVQLAGFLNKNTKGGHFLGVQSALWNQAPHTNLYGVVLGFFNQNGYVRGFQLGVINTVDNLGGLQAGLTAQGKKVWGIQSALVATHARKIIGLQVGAVNIAHRVVGLQLGLYNRAESLSGLQIGLINVHTMGPMKFFPLINVGF